MMKKMQSAPHGGDLNNTLTRNVCNVSNEGYDMLDKMLEVERDDMNASVSSRRVLLAGQ